MTHIQARTRLAEICDEMTECERTQDVKRLRKLAQEALSITEERAEVGDFTWI